MPSSTAPVPNLDDVSAPNWNPVMVLLAAVVCVLVLVLTYYRTLQLLCGAIHGVTFSRNHGRRRQLNETNLEDPSLPFHSRGLESAIMRSLPITHFKDKKNEEESRTSPAGSNECAVCLGKFEEGEWLKHLPNCKHVFHVACIDTWFETHSSCPLCRSFVYDVGAQREACVPMNTLLETLRREDSAQERTAYYQNLRSEILQTSAHREEETRLNLLTPY